MSSQQVNCLFFAKSREITGTSQTTISFPQRPLLGREVLDIICKAFPKFVVTSCYINVRVLITCRLQVLRGTVILSINQAYIDLDSTITINSGDEVAVIPPISGGYV